jgi:hypothetical protein
MKVAEFEGTVRPNGQIEIPAEVAGQLTPGESLHVVLQRDIEDEDSAWRAQLKAGCRQNCLPHAGG